MYKKWIGNNFIPHQVWISISIWFCLPLDRPNVHFIFPLYGMDALFPKTAFISTLVAWCIFDKVLFTRDDLLFTKIHWTNSITVESFCFVSQYIGPSLNFKCIFVCWFAALAIFNWSFLCRSPFNRWSFHRRNFQCEGKWRKWNCFKQLGKSTSIESK